MKFRKVKILKEKFIPFEKLKKGDLFRVLPTSSKDIHVDPDQLLLAESDPVKDSPEGNFAIKAKLIFCVESSINKKFEANIETLIGILKKQNKYLLEILKEISNPYMQH